MQDKKEIIENLIHTLNRMFENIPSDTSLWKEEWKTIYHKEYVHSKKITPERKTLLALQKKGSSLSELFAKRKSSHVFLNNLEAEELLHLLLLATQVNNKETGSRAYPSGGSLYPIEIYYVNTKISNLPIGLYHYSQVKETLCCIKELSPSDPSLNPFPSNNDYYSTLPSYLIFTYDPRRNTNKYGPLGVKLGLIELGCVVQNISLTAAHMDYQVRAIAGFEETVVRDLLELGRSGEAPLLLLAIGKEK